MNIAVFCGSSALVEARFLEAGRDFGRAAAQRGHALVYGGASVGLMGAVANAALEAGGPVVGVIPKVLVDAEVAHPNLTRLEVVDTLHQRKARMAELSDAFAVLPGGLGTLDELFDVLTWKTLGLHHKPMALLDTEGFWQPLRALLQHLARARFASSAQLDPLAFCATPTALLDALSETK